LLLLQSVTNSCLFVPTKGLVTRPKRIPRHHCGDKSPSEVCFPSAYSLSFGALHLAAFHCHQVLRPQGFAPSRRLAPRKTCRTYFVPVPLLGFCPPRVLSSTDVGVLSDALTLVTFGMISFVLMLCLQGFTHRPSRARRAKLFTRIASPPFLGFLSCEVSCPESLPPCATSRV